MLINTVDSQLRLLDVARTCPLCGSGALVKLGDILTCSSCGERRHLDGSVLRVVPKYKRKGRR